MGKFKVGDRVRVLESEWKEAPVGSLGEVVYEGDRSADVKIDGGDGFGWYFDDHQIELITPDHPAEWQPKVGDRVRFKEKYGHHNAGDEVTIAGFDSDCEIVSTDTNHSVFVHRLEPLPVAAEAQPAAQSTGKLTIETGKFYRTRDGRKVGPVGPNEGGLQGYPWQDDSSWSDCWTADGRYYEDVVDSVHDLIAEWADEPAAPVAVAATASNDNFLDSLIGKAFTTKVKSRVNPAIVCLVEDGQPKPAAMPHVHASTNLATKEAERLALKHPGQEFGVFVLAGSKIADVVNVPTAVLRAA